MSNLLDDIISFFSPESGLKRQRARMVKAELSRQRGYDAAKKNYANNMLALSSSSAKEVSKAANALAANAQEICRNNALALRIKFVWANAIVGKGIKLRANISNKQRGKSVVNMLDKWSVSTDCDFDGNLNFSGLQWLWASTIVETGGVFVRFHFNRELLKAGKFPVQFQTIEQTYLDRTKNDGDKIIDGIQYNRNGQPEGYWLLSEESGLNMTGKQKSVYYVKDAEIVHIYRKERPGQHLGVTWLAQVLLDLEKYSTLKEALLMQQQVAACFGVIISEATTATGVNGDGTADRPDEIFPGSIYYVKDGQTVNTINPPRSHDQGQFITNLKSDIATGVNITYAQLTGDYSKFNFASGRMGKNDFFENLDTAQNNMMIPALDKIGDYIENIVYVMTGLTMSSIWELPSRNTVNPMEDLDYIIKQVRAGLLSPSGAARLLGRKLEDVVDQWKKDKKVFGELPFDLDPSKFSSAGNQLDANDAAASNNQQAEAGVDAKGTTD